jgi:hypothetical protein
MCGREFDVPGRYVLFAQPGAGGAEGGSEYHSADTCQPVPAGDSAGTAVSLDFPAGIMPLRAGVFHCLHGGAEADKHIANAVFFSGIGILCD